MWIMLCFCGVCDVVDTSVPGEECCAACGRLIHETPTPEWAQRAIEEAFERIKKEVAIAESED